MAKKIALVLTLSALLAGCPAGGPQIVDEWTISNPRLYGRWLNTQSVYFEQAYIFSENSASFYTWQHPLESYPYEVDHIFIYDVVWSDENSVFIGKWVDEDEGTYTGDYIEYSFLSDVSLLINGIVYSKVESLPPSVNPIYDHY